MFVEKKMFIMYLVKKKIIKQRERVKMIPDINHDYLWTKNNSAIKKLIIDRDHSK